MASQHALRKATLPDMQLALLPVWRCSGNIWPDLNEQVAAPAEPCHQMLDHTHHGKYLNLPLNKHSCTVLAALFLSVHVCAVSSLFVETLFHHKTVRGCELHMDCESPGCQFHRIIHWNLTEGLGVGTFLTHDHMRLFWNRSVHTMIAPTPIIWSSFLRRASYQTITLSESSMEGRYSVRSPSASNIGRRRRRKEIHYVRTASKGL